LPHTAATDCQGFAPSQTYWKFVQIVTAFNLIFAELGTWFVAKTFWRFWKFQGTKVGQQLVKVYLRDYFCVPMSLTVLKDPVLN
jgi:hypothetical protein